MKPPFLPSRLVSHHRRHCKRRTGSVYIVALGTSLIIACLALASLQGVRVQRRNGDVIGNSSNATYLALAGLEFAQQQTVSNANWRSSFTHGVAVSKNVTGGSFSITLTDPTDGNIANRTTDPVLVTSTGIVGSVRQTLSIYLEPQTQLFGGCRGSMYSVGLMTFNNCTINSNAWAFSENKIKTNGTCNINMNCLAATNVEGGGYNQRKVVGGLWPMDKPGLVAATPTYVGNSYSSSAVAISPSSLPTGGAELVTNPGFETNVSNWSTSNCSITRETNQKKSGLASCKVNNFIPFFSSSIRQEIANSKVNIVKGHDYLISFWVRPSSDDDFYATLKINIDGSSPTYIYGEDKSCDSGVWTKVSSTVTATWSGVMSSVELRIDQDDWTDFYVDDISITDLDRETGKRYIENVLLTNTVNPYGSVSSSGIYSINAPGEKIVIRNSRIAATLLVDSSTGVEMNNAVNWEPSGRYYPAIISNAPIDDLTSSATLSESTTGVNFNPSTSPYGGSSNSTTSNTYDGRILGAIVSTQGINLAGSSALTGPVVAGSTLTVNASTLNLSYMSDMILNPPPGFFDNPPAMRAVSSSFQTAP